MNFSDVKITVLKRVSTDEVFREYAAEDMQPSCSALPEGKEFTSKGMAIPEGFCSWAWADIQRYII